MSGPMAATFVAGRSYEVADNSDRCLVARAQVGDLEAFSELVRRHHRGVYHLACRFMREEAMGEDMTQEAFLKAFRLLGGFRGDCSFSTWMYKVTCSVCLTELRRHRRRGDTERASLRNGMSGEIVPRVSDVPELVRRCVSRLPERYATVLALYYFDGIPYEEIAGALGIPMGTLKTWMHRARRRLRGIVERELGKDARAAL